MALWHDNARRNGMRSSAALPLFDGDRVEGVLMFNSPEPATFTPEFVDLLQRLADNVAFALVSSITPTRRRRPKCKRNA